MICKTQALKLEVPVKHVSAKKIFQMYHEHLESFPPIFLLLNC